MNKMFMLTAMSCILSIIKSYSQTLCTVADLRITGKNISTANSLVFDGDVVRNNHAFLSSHNRSFHPAALKKNFYQPPKQPTTTDKIFIDFVGTGDIQKTISSGHDLNANTGLGIVYERINDEDDKLFQSIELEALINIFTTSDTLTGNFLNNTLQNRRTFSAYLLNPVSARQASYINMNYYFGYPKKNGRYTTFAKIANYMSGMNARFIASNNVWQHNADTIRNIGALYARFGIFHEIIPDNHRISAETGRSKYSCFIGVNYTFRGIFGDLSASQNADIRKKILGSDKKTFSGVELDFGFKLNNIRAEFQMPILKGTKASIEGLTNTQFLFTIKFVGGFGLQLNPNSNGTAGNGNSPGT